jgi:hypothetical protein
MAATTLLEWEGFFTFVGLVAGGLTGLIFVALSIQVGGDRTGRMYVSRARTTLDNLSGILVLCGLALIPGQTERSFGIEGAILNLVLIWDILRTVRSFERPGASLERPVLIRTSLALTTLGVGLVGSLVLIAGVGEGLLLVGAGALLGLPVRILQAWALIEASLAPSHHRAPPRKSAG